MRHSISRIELEKEFEEFFDRVMDPVKIGNISYPPSLVIKALDPIAYQTGLRLYIDMKNTKPKN